MEYMKVSNAENSQDKLSLLACRIQSQRSFYPRSLRIVSKSFNLD